MLLWSCYYGHMFILQESVCAIEKQFKMIEEEMSETDEEENIPTNEDQDTENNNTPS